MKTSLRLGEVVMVSAGLLMAVSLPLLVRESYALWFGSQALYFLGAAILLIRFVVRGDA